MANKKSATPWKTRVLNSTQPLEAANIDGALLKIQTVIAITGLSAATIYRKVADGEFVEPVRMGKRCTRYRSEDVKAWIEAQVA
jgi:predicted DNA-binding transcriptional regulator AlpA